MYLASYLSIYIRFRVNPIHTYIYIYIYVYMYMYIYIYIICISDKG